MSVLLFLGLFMVVPLGFSIIDLRDMEAAVERLGATEGELGDQAGRAGASSADGALAHRVLGLLTEAVARARRPGARSPGTEQERAVQVFDRFVELWKVFQCESPRAFAAVPGLGKVLSLSENGGSDDWREAYELIRGHEGRSWPEDPAGLRAGLEKVLGAADEKQYQDAYRAFKNDALVFRNRLLEVGRVAAARDGTGEGSSAALVALQVRGAGKLVLEELVDAKRREISRVAFLVAVGGILALLFARILWRDLLDPLERLRRSINNMAMSGTPTPVDTHGPHEVREVLQAYNRLIDMIAAEGQRADVKPCPKCNVTVENSDSYCRACGFPL